MRGKNALIGAETVAQNGYRYRKVADSGPNQWRLLHHIVAEEEILGRPLMPHEMVRFRDPKDRQNVTKENLMVVPRGVSSLNRRRAQLEARIEELQAQLDAVNRELNAHARS